jgi:diamine N-acetyltransferase
MSFKTYYFFVKKNTISILLITFVPSFALVAPNVQFLIFNSSFLIVLMHIRPATEQDFSTIIDLAAQIWQPTYGHILSREQLHFMFECTYTVAELQRQVGEGQHFYLIFNTQNTPVGYAAWSWQTELYKEKPLPKLNKIYVLPTEQGNGTGKILLQYIENEVFSLSANALQLCVNRYNTAKGFYERQGYRVLYEADFPFYHYFMNDFVMQKDFLDF